MTDERLKKSADEGRENRAMTDRVITENREVSESERVEMFRQNLFQSSLPDLRAGTCAGLLQLTHEIQSRCVFASGMNQ